jgi:hypothetical protein
MSEPEGRIPTYTDTPIGLDPLAMVDDGVAGT